MDGSRTLIVRIDLPDDQRDNFLDLMEEGFNRGSIDGYYILTDNTVPVTHNEPHLQYETRLGRAISALQRDEILITGLADTDPETGIEYGELT
jgi:hypothetical protein